MGRPPKPDAERKDTTIAVRLPNDLYLEVVKMCEMTKVSKSDYLRHIIWLHLKGHHLD